MKNNRPYLALVGLLALLTPTSARAQEPSAEEARIHLGPLGLTPRIALTNVGVDTNVLNQALNPQRDFTMTFLPGIDSWLRIGRAQLMAKTSGEFIYFRQLDAQRSLGFSQQGRIALLLNHVTPFVQAEYTDTSRRPNAELDARVQQVTTSMAAGATFRLGWRVHLALSAQQDRLELGDEQFRGVDLAKALDRRTQRVGGDLRIQLTPLTTFVVRNAVQHDRFTYSAERDTDSLSVIPGFEFKPIALISGTAFAGFRHFQPRRANQPAIDGLVAAMTLRYRAGDTTLLDGTFDRDVEYSFDAGEPYFVWTAGAFTLTQAIGGPWDAVGRIGQQRLAYQELAGSTGRSSGARLDRVATVGSGVGYRLGIGARIGFDVNYVRRLSPLSSRHYHGFQFGGSFTYGS